MCNVIIIGMPACGKSTVGTLLAKRLDAAFLDGDDLIRAETGRSLPELIASMGQEAFLALEADILSSLKAERSVIAPGGSAVYSPKAMEALRRLGKIVYLETPLASIEERIPDPAARGVVFRSGNCSLEALYAERRPLYERYADVTVACEGRTPEETAEEIVRLSDLPKRQVCIYGAGAMGTSLGVFLSGRGIPVLLVTRNAAHEEAVKRDGAVLLGPDGKETARGTDCLSACTPQELSGKFSVIILSTRQHDNAAVAAFLKDYLAEDGALVTIQNGLPEEGLAETLGRDRIYGATLGWGAELTSPGVVTVTSNGEYPISIGAYGNGARLPELAAMLQAQTGDLMSIRYSKLIVNAAFSTLSAISGLTFGELAVKHARIVLAIMREVTAVAEADGAKKLVQNGHDLGKYIGSPLARLLLPFAMRKHRNIRSGMLVDLSRGRRCDVDFVAGRAVERGRCLHVPTPYLAAAVELVHDAESGLVEIAPETLAFLEKN